MIPAVMGLGLYRRIRSSRAFRPLGGCHTSHVWRARRRSLILRFWVRYTPCLSFSFALLSSPFLHSSLLLQFSLLLHSSLLLNSSLLLHFSLSLPPRPHPPHSTPLPPFHNYPLTSLRPHRRPLRHRNLIQTRRALRPQRHQTRFSPPQPVVRCTHLLCKPLTSVRAPVGAGYGVVGSRKVRFSGGYNVPLATNPFNSWAKVLDCGDIPVTS